MKKIINSLIISFLAFFGMFTTVFAAGSATMSLAGNGSVVKGGEITFTITVSNITGVSDGKVSGIGGFINFDPEYLQYVSYTNVDTDNWGKTVKTTSLAQGKLGKFASYDSSGETGMTGGIAKVKFKALKSGSTTLSFSNAEASDKAANLISITAQSKTISITEPLSTDNNLKSLTVEGYTLSPSFAAGTTAYTVNLPTGTTSVKISATANHAQATVGGDIGTQSITSDTVVKTVTCKSQSGATKSYKITFKRTPAPVSNSNTPVSNKPSNSVLNSTVQSSNDSTLKSLSVAGYAISPSFTKNNTSYSVTVPNGVTGLNVTAVPNHAKATYKISGASGFAVGKNTIAIKVTAEDGSSTTYNIVVTRQSEEVKSSDTNVDLRILSANTMTPTFSNSINSYDVVVPSNISKLQLSVTPYDKKTNVKIIGNDTLSADKPTTIKVVVTAEDGTSKTIVLKVTKSKIVANTDLLDLKVEKYEISPKFEPSVTSYKVTVPSKENSVNVIVKAPEGATYTVTGNTNLQEGDNTVIVNVKDKNGFEKNYEIIVTKQKASNLWKLLLLLLLLLLLILFIIILLKRKKDKEEEEYDEDDEELLNTEVSEEDMKDALDDFSKNKGTDKLQMLIDQANLNKRKLKLKSKEKKSKKS